MKNRISNIVAYAAGLCMPVASFVYILFHPCVKYYKAVFVLFFTFVGIAFFYSGYGADVYRYVEEFEYVYSLGNIDFLEYFKTLPQANQIDYYSSFLRWVVSRFTGDYRVFLGVSALIYALFFAGNVAYITNLLNKNDLGYVLSVLMILLVLTPNICFLTHRWWAAMQVFIYGALPVLFEKKYSRIIWCFLSFIVFHFSFIYPLIFLVLSIFAPKKYLLPYVLLFIICCLMGSFKFDFMTPYIERFMPGQTVERTIMYINAEEQSHNFLSQSARIFMKLANVSIVAVLFAKDRDGIKTDLTLRNLFVTVLLIGSFSEITNMTEWGWRYLDLSNMFFVIFYIYYYSLNKDKVLSNNLFKILSPFFIYVIIYQIRGFLSIIGPLQLFIGNYFTTWFIHDSVSVLDMIKQVL